jgi:hypothetical protein
MGQFVFYGGRSLLIIDLDTRFACCSGTTAAVSLSSYLTTVQPLTYLYFGQSFDTDELILHFCPVGLIRTSQIGPFC